jgi:hypothetical protein
MALPNRMSLRPGLLCLTTNLALIIQRLSRNIVCFQFYIPRKRFSRTPARRQLPYMLQRAVGRGGSSGFRPSVRKCLWYSGVCNLPFARSD